MSEQQAVADRASIRVHVRLFAAYREAVGAGRLDYTVREGHRVSDLVAALEAEFPRLRASRGAVAVNQDYVGPGFMLHEGDEVALIPPVSGGQG